MEKLTEKIQKYCDNQGWEYYKGERGIVISIDGDHYFGGEESSKVWKFEISNNKDRFFITDDYSVLKKLESEPQKENCVYLPNHNPCKLSIDHIDNRLEYICDFNIETTTKEEKQPAKIRAVVVNARLRSLARWFENMGDEIYGGNVREKIKDKNDVNKSIENTLEKEKQNFWLFNNGITVYTEKPIVVKNKNEIELFEPNILNGAQTFSSLLAFYKKEANNNSDNGFVQVRIIYPLGKKDNSEFRIKSKIGIALNRQKPINGANILYGHLADLDFFDTVKYISIEKDAKNVYFLADFAQDFITTVYQKPGTARAQKAKITLTSCEFTEYYDALKNANEDINVNGIEFENLYKSNVYLFIGEEIEKIKEGEEIQEGENSLFINELLERKPEEIYNDALINTLRIKKVNDLINPVDKKNYINDTRFIQAYISAEFAKKNYGEKFKSEIELAKYILLTESNDFTLTQNNIEPYLTNYKKHTKTVSDILDKLKTLTLIEIKDLLYNSSKFSEKASEIQIKKEANKKADILEWANNFSADRVPPGSTIAQIGGFVLSTISEKLVECIDVSDREKMKEQEIELLISCFVQRGKSSILTNNMLPILTEEWKIEFHKLFVLDSNIYKLDKFYYILLKIAGILEWEDES